jgi:type II secretory pathway pseudopilin PulG
VKNIQKRRLRQGGFSMLEMLYVVAIVIIVAGLTIPNLLTSEKSAYEAVTISYMRNLVNAQEIYRMRFGSFAADTGQLTAQQLADEPIPRRFGYVISVDNPPGSQTDWWATAQPLIPGRTGDRHFYIDASGVLRAVFGAPADRTSPPLNSG